LLADYIGLTIGQALAVSLYNSTASRPSSNVES
jgi:hypothetical protein